MGFDIDSCTAGYDGSRVWCLPRCRRALTKRCDFVLFCFVLFFSRKIDPKKNQVQFG